MKNLSILLGLLVLSFSTSALASASLTCNGTEPFWSLILNSNEATFSTPDLKASLNIVVPQSYNSDHAWVYQTSEIGTGKAVIAIVTRGQCSDGMSETKYPLRVIYVSGDQLLKGCCLEN
jgi:uncharacterized membrane protein